MLEVSYAEFAASLPEMFARAKAGEEIMVMEEGEYLMLSNIDKNHSSNAMHNFIQFCKNNRFGLSSEEIKTSIEEGRKY